MAPDSKWDPEQYRRFAGERSRPFFDLTGRVGAGRPRSVVDLGCGTGALTATLAERWPEAQVEGLDSSAEMIAEAARRTIPGRLHFALGDLREWRPDAALDVVVSNAALQWVQDHVSLLEGWVEALAPGGWLAFQVPGNDRSPSHVLLDELREAPRWRDRLREAAPGPRVLEPAEYLACLTGLGCVVDAWETTYLHVLRGADPVLEWVKGTALRPVLTTLDPGEQREFLAEYATRLREAYPAQPFGTVLPFRRLFVVAHLVE
ncbi:MAG TPA: trans-aconitate 2-methyltransferase [Candidatus Dormibacteraeota bacterium]